MPRSSPAPPRARRAAPVEQLREHLIATEPVTAAEVDLFLGGAADETSHSAPPFIISPWGRRPAV
jgi:hypothetical protein